MKTILKKSATMIVALMAMISFSFAQTSADAPPSKLKNGTSVNLASQDVVWHRNHDYVVQYNERDYLVKTDDDEHAIVVKRITNLADFVQYNGGTGYMTRVVPGFYEGPIYAPGYYPAPVVIHPYHRPHPHFIVRPHWHGHRFH